MAQRVEDLLQGMTLEDQAGLMFHELVVTGPDDTLVGAENMIGRPATVDAVADLRMRAAAALLVNYGASDDALVDVLTGTAQARGRRPFDRPSCRAAVKTSRSDVTFDTAQPLFRSATGSWTEPEEVFALTRGEC